MKKVVFAAVAVVLFGISYAQEVKFGAKGGLNLSTLSGDDDTAMKVGFQVGGFAEISVTEKFAIQPELLYSTQGTKYDGTGDPSLHLDYLNIPVMAKFFVTEGLSLEAGPQVGFLLSAKLKTDAGDADFKEYVNSTDFGLNFGVGYDVTDNISLGVRYGFGVSDVNKEGNNSIKNSNFSFALGYKF
ncbi:porin family protein [Flavobacterium sp. NRK F7]|uniref:porin family protein n=1 Tax=Flavobacterium sp. NRK F7 TaxID=2954930 RepID=UPI0020913EF6|nr:porin family protein [Flavobacterium sp. NRK F7]MCO6162619.1 PorT family protein [Flavobacterium sp. NRK F7]